MPTTDYINEINKLLNLADEELLDFVYQLLQKSLQPLTPLETLEQSV